MGNSYESIRFWSTVTSFIPFLLIILIIIYVIYRSSSTSIYNRSYKTNKPYYLGYIETVVKYIEDAVKISRYVYSPTSIRIDFTQNGIRIILGSESSSSISSNALYLRSPEIVDIATEWEVCPNDFTGPGFIADVIFQYHLSININSSDWVSFNNAVWNRVKSKHPDWNVSGFALFL